MRTSVRTLAAIVLAAAVATGAAACSSGSGSSASPASPASTGTSTSTAGPTATTAPAGAITVFAAASLKATFTKLGTDFQAANPGTTVTFSFAGSSDLVTQITGGAPADVFASADTKNMTKLTDAALVSGTPVDFATNILEIATPPGNPAGVTSFQDLANPDIKTVICAPAVPCGAATVTVETATGVTIPAVSEESAVTDVLGKVSSGEADAGLVYATDVQGAGSTVEGVPFTESSKAVNTYPIAALSDTKSAGLAQAFIDYVTGTEGQAVLSAAGFGKP
ncbi:molybdate ABC transporter substrate-binding protein [Subtercola boreus]|uniref:Molybdate ABC transporter substrate-binding protein n=1 Tax=Subtercola boreus TaxID=120213 RepID=A0A3E0VG86_9MICO|nr:molybdate ABC transporter substrate-binding protein [Subtercola boreus]RFA08563.1 molybdate ABC transporter substrate-binding protein [Subtercola boreus]TQL54502.1 molybdate transport system substrate-binding protein [Subtercola boreus]